MTFFSFSNSPSTTPQQKEVGDIVLRISTTQNTENLPHNSIIEKEGPSE